jgi:hypothetical protein
VLAERPGDRYNTCREFMDAAAVALAGLAAEPLSGLAAVPLSGLAAVLLSGVDSHPVPPAPESAGGQPAAAPETSQLAAAAPGGRQPELGPASVAYQREAAPDRAESGPEVTPEPAGDPWQPARDVPTPAASAGSGNGRRRGRWLVIAAVLLLVCGGGGAGAYAALSSHQNTTTSTPSAMASKPMPQRAPASLLAQVLTSANASRIAMGMLPPSSCAQRGEAKVLCLAPSPAIASATFTTYPTLTALYSAYKAAIRSLNHKHYRQNVANCGLSAPSPYGEIAWNHREKHSRAYTAAEMIAGKVPVETAMGRMACLATASHSEDIVWTTDYGKMLGVAIGTGSHTGVWLWWAAVHHNIIFPGTPMDMGGAAPLMSGAPMPTSSAGASRSMTAKPSPSMSKPDS